MAEPTLILSMAALRGVGRMLPGEPSLLSPMYGPEPAGASDVVEELERVGVVDGSGGVGGPFADTLATLMSPRSFTRVTVHETAGDVEHTVVYAKADKRAIVLSPTVDGVMIRDPGPAKRIADGLTQLFGMSALGGSDFAGEVSPSVALVLATIIDSFRRMTFGELATEAPLSTQSVSGIRHILETGAQGRQWLLTAVTTQLAEVQPADDIDLDAALNELVDLGLIKSDGKEVVLAGAARESLQRMLLVRRGLSVTAGRDDEDGMTYVDFSGISFGMHDILRLEEINGLVRFELTSSAMFIGHVAHLLLDPAALVNPAGVKP